MVNIFRKKEGQKTFSETKNIKRQDSISEAKKGEVFEKFKKVFPDIELLEVKKEE